MWPIKKRIERLLYIKDRDNHVFITYVLQVSLS